MTESVRIAGKDDYILRTCANRVPADGKLRARLREKLEQALFSKPGAVGLAAPQIFSSYQAIALKTKRGVITAFNPKVIAQSCIKRPSKERCLSFESRYWVKRPLWCVIEYEDVLSRRFKYFCRYREARVILHEVDHLNGRCIDEGVKER